MFLDRADAGSKLAKRLRDETFVGPVVLALPRGGVPVALPVAEALDAPLDLLMVRKIGCPGHRELAAGAIVDGASPHAVWNQDVLKSAGLDESGFEAEVAAALAEIERRRADYLGGREPVSVTGRTAVVVDDGVATGATARVALEALQKRDAAEVVLAVPVASGEALAELRGIADRVICLDEPRPFYAVGAHYRRFGQTSDAEVRAAIRARDAED